MIDSKIQPVDAPPGTKINLERIEGPLISSPLNPLRRRRGTLRPYRTGYTDPRFPHPLAVAAGGDARSRGELSPPTKNPRKRASPTLAYNHSPLIGPIIYLSLAATYSIYVIGRSHIVQYIFFSRIHHGEVYQSYRRGAKRHKGAANKRWQVLTLSLLS
jgi:hypothetical protein